MYIWFTNKPLVVLNLLHTRTKTAIIKTNNLDLRFRYAMFSWLAYKLTKRHHTSFMSLLLILMRMSNGVESRRTVRPQSSTVEGARLQTILECRCIIL